MVVFWPPYPPHPLVPPTFPVWRPAGAAGQENLFNSVQTPLLSLSGRFAFSSSVLSLKRGVNISAASAQPPPDRNVFIPAKLTSFPFVLDPALPRTFSRHRWATLGRSGEKYELTTMANTRVLPQVKPEKRGLPPGGWLQYNPCGHLSWCWQGTRAKLTAFILWTLSFFPPKHSFTFCSSCLNVSFLQEGPSLFLLCLFLFFLYSSWPNC